MSARKPRTLIHCFYCLSFTLFSGLLILTSFQVYATHSGSVGLGASTGASAINTDSALPLPPGMVTFGLSTEYVKLDTLSDNKLLETIEAEPEADLHSIDEIITTSFSAAFGVSENFTIGLRLPYVWRLGIREPEHHEDGDEDAEHDDDAVTEHDDDEDNDHDNDDDPDAEGVGEVQRLGNSRGIGDLVVFGQYRFLQDLTNNRNASVLLGFKAPTGRTSDKTNSGEKFETEVQPGTGSWDGLFGLAYSETFGPLSFDSNILYSLVTEGSQNTDLGDIINYNFATSYRLFGGGNPGRRFTTQDGLAMDATFEVNGQWRDKLEINGNRDRNSGGHQLYLSPGFRLMNGQAMSVGFSFGIPVISDFNGVQDNLDYRVLGTFNFAFD